MSIFRGLGFGMPPRPKKRRDQLSETYIFQLRIDLVGASPPIWRRIEIRSDVTLWTLHRVIQGAFDWFDAHLYLFSLGHPYSWESELFLCESDMRAGDEEGTFVRDVRIDETLQDPGDQLEYLYDYGDDWHHKIKLEKAQPAFPNDPIAVATAGRRAAPPEDSGGLVDAESLAEFFPDPAFFDLEATNDRINGWLETAGGFAPADGFGSAEKVEPEEHPQLMRFPQFRHILDHFSNEVSRHEVLRRLQELEIQDGIEANRWVPDEAELQESLSAVRFLLEEIGTGIKLTSAGYLPPKIAYRVGEELGLSGYELSSGGESNMIQVRDFRAALQHAGLLRKRKGELLLTKPARAGVSDSALFEDVPLLWNHIANRLLPGVPSTRSFAHDGGLLTLLFAATSRGEFDLDSVATAITDSGWRVDNDVVKRHHVVFEGAWQAVLLWYIAPKDQRRWFSNTASPAASALARAALLRMSSRLT